MVKKLPRLTSMFWRYNRLHCLRLRSLLLPLQHVLSVALLVQFRSACRTCTSPLRGIANRVGYRSYIPKHQSLEWPNSLVNFFKYSPRGEPMSANRDHSEYQRACGGRKIARELSTY